MCALLEQGKSKIVISTLGNKGAILITKHQSCLNIGMWSVLFLIILF
jgi:hypothetical protein